MASILIPYTENSGRGKNWQVWQTLSHSPKFSSPMFTESQKTYNIMAHALTVVNSPNLSSLITFTYMHGSPKFSLAKYFPCTVYPYGKYKVVQACYNLVNKVNCKLVTTLSQSCTTLLLKV